MINRKAIMAVIWGVGSGALGATIIAGGKPTLIFILGLICILLA